MTTYSSPILDWEIGRFCFVMFTLLVKFSLNCKYYGRGYYKFLLIKGFSFFEFPESSKNLLEVALGVKIDSLIGLCMI